MGRHHGMSTEIDPVFRFVSHGTDCPCKDPKRQRLGVVSVSLVLLALCCGLCFSEHLCCNRCPLYHRQLLGDNCFHPQPFPESIGPFPEYLQPIRPECVLRALLLFRSFVPGVHMVIAQEPRHFSLENLQIYAYEYMCTHNIYEKLLF